jgi:hypothetical protein
MNIFWLSRKESECASWHCDRHVVKMILESCQLLSTAHRVLDGKLQILVSPDGHNKHVYVLPDETWRWKAQELKDDDGKIFTHYSLKMSKDIYIQTHVNHPCAWWVRQYAENYYRLFSLAMYLCAEYEARYDRKHVCEELLINNLALCPNNIPLEGNSLPPLAMPEYIKELFEDKQMSWELVEVAYQMYYNLEKQHIAYWRKPASIPPWFVRKERI